MTVRKRQLKHGIRWAYDKTVKGTRLFSPYLYLEKHQAEEDEFLAARHFRMTGEKLEPWKEDEKRSETVLMLYARWVRWLKLHRSKRHASDMQTLIKRALQHAPELADLPAAELTVKQVEDWAERWVRALASPPTPPKFEKPKLGEEPKKQPKPKKPRGPRRGQ